MRPFWLEQALAAGVLRAVRTLGGRYPRRCVHRRQWLHRVVDRDHAQGTEPATGCVADRGGHLRCRRQWRNGGCALSWSAKYFTLERLFGVEEAVRLVKESERSIYAIGTFCEQYGVDADYHLDGTLYTATNRAQCGSTDAVIAALERHGINSFTSGRLRMCSAWPVPASTWKAGFTGRQRATGQTGARFAPGGVAVGRENS